jgi:hypothetical protein
MDKYKTGSPRLNELKKQRAQIDDEIKREHAFLAKEKADALCKELSKRKSK